MLPVWGFGQVLPLFFKNCSFLLSVFTAAATSLQTLRRKQEEWTASEHPSFSTKAGTCDKDTNIHCTAQTGLWLQLTIILSINLLIIFLMNRDQKILSPRRCLQIAFLSDQQSKAQRYSIYYNVTHLRSCNQHISVFSWHFSLKTFAHS